jgi:ElaB/YqjD/DUF883 family membrane-anchored ribosome-binding protein
MAAKAEQDGKFALFRSYKRSQQLFVTADALGKKAAGDAKAEKERVKAEVQGLLEKAKMMLDETGAALAKAPVGKGNKAEIELMKSDLAAATAAFDEASNEFNNGKYLGARAKVQAVINKTQVIADELAKAAAAKGGKKR